MIHKVWNEPEIYCIKVELPQNSLHTLNVYVILSHGYSLIIDTGLHRQECHVALWNGIQELGIDLSKTILFLTHYHPDHTGLVWSFVEKGIPIYMGKVDYECMEHLYDGKFYRDIKNRLLREGFPGHAFMQQLEQHGLPFAPEPGFPIIPVENGQSIPLAQLQITALQTPGHTPGHMALYLPREQLLFSGDHILFGITPNIGLDQVPGILSAYIDSLQNIRQLPIRAIFPAHRSADKDVYQRINELLFDLDHRAKEIYQAVKFHPGCTGFQVAGKITWFGRKNILESLSGEQQILALSETLAHLEHLVNRGQLIRVETKKNVQYYLNQS